ncbi:MAG: tetratricopeptide repeat protein, partial [Holophagales bacterium]|nr:tetratricopeptide repeat protein [Holophagales bacterium]
EVSQGVSLPLSEAEADPWRELYGETLYGRISYGWSPLQRWTSREHTLIRGPRLELYDLLADPGELRGLGTARPRLLEESLERLGRLRRRLADGGRGFSRGETSREALARLAALGYAGGSAELLDSDEVDPERPNPAEMMEVFNLDMEAGTYLDTGAFELAVPLLERAEKLDPENPSLLASLARGHLGLGASERARGVLGKLLRIDPRSVPAHLLLARVHRAAGEGERALAMLERVVAIDPSDLASRLQWAHLAEDSGRPEEAEEVYRGILERQAGHALALNGLATLLYRRGEVEPARELLEKAVGQQPFYAPAVLNLGVIEHDRGEHGRALRLAERALALRPHDPRALELRRLAADASSR